MHSAAYVLRNKLTVFIITRLLACHLLGSKAGLGTAWRGTVQTVFKVFSSVHNFFTTSVWRGKAAKFLWGCGERKGCGVEEGEKKGSWF